MKHTLKYYRLEHSDSIVYYKEDLDGWWWRRIYKDDNVSSGHKWNDGTLLRKSIHSNSHSNERHRVGCVREITKAEAYIEIL